MILKLDGLAGTTGLEPATSDVTGRRSNQLNYHSAFSNKKSTRILTTIFSSDSFSGGRYWARTSDPQLVDTEPMFADVSLACRYSLLISTFR